MPLRYGVDTNVLLRLSHPGYPQFEAIGNAMRKLIAHNVGLCFTPQNIGEFWNTSTRPRERNGFGLPLTQADEYIQLIARRMTLLLDDERVYQTWRRLLREHDVRGVQVHDAHLAASLEVHGATHLLTFNETDFKRFTAIKAISPEFV